METPFPNHTQLKAIETGDFFDKPVKINISFKDLCP